MSLYHPPYQLDEVKLEVTQFCPLDCLHCSSASNPGKSQQLEEEKVNEIIDDCAKLGVQTIVFSGGEPLTWQAIYRALRRCQEVGLESTIYTTGISSIELKNDSEFLVKELKKCGMNQAIFSLHGANSKTHDNVTRVAGSFDVSVKAIKAFTTSKIRCELHFVPLCFNYKELNDLIDLAIRVDVKKVSLLRFVPHGRGSISKDIGPLSKKENLQLRKNIVELKKDKKIDIRLGSPYNILALNCDVYCKAGINTIVIKPSGKVYPCDAFKNIDEKDRFGSVLDYRLTIVWQKSEYLNKVRKYLAGGYPQVCKSCTQITKCKSGCLAQKVIKNGSFRKSKDPDCLFQ